ncbi:hypothetical protein TNCV_91851 [Trichonephila clavipes]|nr:hypothetical protein TNCV_91851 [Trichonephila clavipes]
MYGESTIARSKVYEWHRCFKEGRKSIEDDEHVGRPTSRNKENVTLVSECVRKYRHQRLALTAEETHFLKTLFEGIHSWQATSVLAKTGIFCMTKHQYIDPNWKKHLLGRRFVSSDEMNGASQVVLREVAKNGFQELYERLQECIVTQELRRWINCGGGDRGRVAIYRPFGESLRAKIALSPVWCSRPTTGVPLAHATMNFVGLDLTPSDSQCNLQNFECKHCVVQVQYVTLWYGVPCLLYLLCRNWDGHNWLSMMLEWSYNNIPYRLIWRQIWSSHRAR